MTITNEKTCEVCGRFSCDGIQCVTRRYDPKFWQRVSNKYHHVARLPEGMSGIEALREHAPGEYQRILDQLERQAADTFRRTYANRVEGCHAELSVEEWAAFKAAGGQSSW